MEAGRHGVLTEHVTRLAGLDFRLDSGHVVTLLLNTTGMDAVEIPRIQQIVMLQLVPQVSIIFS